MSADGCIVGTNWNVHLCGYEIEPLDLKKKIEREIGNVSK